MERPYVVFQRLQEPMPKVIQAATFSEVEKSARPWAGTALLPYRQQENGLPERGELDRVCRIEDQLIAALEGQGTIHGGHTTSSGAMRVVFYGRESGPRAVSVKTGILRKEEIGLEWRHDPEWTLFELELQPSPHEELESHYRMLWQKLAEHGDDHKIPRLVDFAANFPTCEQRSAFLEEVRPAGFELSSMATWENEAGFWCELNKTTAVDPPTMIPECLFLKEASKKHGGVFDGWACPVEK